MAARHPLPDPPGDRIRVEPYTTHLRTQYATPQWRKLAKAFTEAACAWRAELKGGEGFRPRVVSFETWRRLRAGAPSAFAAYDDARAKVLAEPTDNPQDLADKIQLAAEILGVADPATVQNAWPEQVPAGGWTAADLLFAMLWRDAHAVRRRAETRRKKGKC